MPKIFSNINDALARAYQLLKTKIMEDPEQVIIMLGQIQSKATLLNIMAYQDNNGDTLLHWAAKVNRANVIPALLSAGAGINVQNRVGDTALLIAAYNDCKNVINILLALGANQSITNNHGMNFAEVTSAFDVVIPEHSRIIS